jgi:hypothetical protein
MIMHKDLGEISPVVFHTHHYLNRGGSGYDVQNAGRWYNGKIQRYGRKSAAGKRLTAKRIIYKEKEKKTSKVNDRMIYLFADHDLSQGDNRIHVCAIFYADEEGNLRLIDNADKIHDYPGLGQVVCIPNVINGKKIKYFALASKIEIPKENVDVWIEHFAEQPPADPDYKSNIAFQIGWCDFDYFHTFLGLEDFEIDIGTDENGQVMTDTVSALKFPVLDPLQMANRQADRLRQLLRRYEREFGFHETLINQSAKSIDDDVKKWAEYRLAIMLSETQNPGLKKKVDEIMPGALGGYLSSRILFQEGYQKAVDLAAGNLAGWLQREVVLAWINLNHFSGNANISKEKSIGKGKAEEAKICVLEDFARATRDLHQTRPGNLLGEVLNNRKDEFFFLDEYLFTGKPMAAVLKTRQALGSLVSIKKLILGRLIARGKVKFVDILKQQGGYLTDADIFKSTDEIFEAESAFVKWLVTGNPSTLTEENLAMDRARISVGKLKTKLGSAEAASGLLSMLGWLSAMESVRAYSELAASEKTKIKDDLSLSAAIAGQSLATAELLLGDELKKASKLGLKVSLSAMGVVVNVIDAGLKAKEAEELFAKGDTDAGVLTAVSVVLIIYSIPFGLMGLWIGTAMIIIAGILGIIAEFVKDDTWDTFLKNTSFGQEIGGGTDSPDWAGVTLNALKANPAFQVRALANLLNNFSVKRKGGGLGDRFGSFTLDLKMATPDPLAVFLLTWHFKVSGEPGIQKRVTVASAFTGATTPADGKNFHVPGTLRAPDGSSLESFEHAAVKATPGSTLMTIGDPYDMRPYQTPSHRWEHRTITGVKVEVQRLLWQSFGRPRSKDMEWTDIVALDLSLPPKEAWLFKV